MHQVGDVSIHAPVWGATRPSVLPCFERAVSIHAPVWGATTAVGVRNNLISFNPRTRVGCDPAPVLGTLETGVSIHAPVWGATADD